MNKAKPENILPAPYVRGQWGVPEKAKRILHIWMALVFVVLPMSAVVAANKSSIPGFQLWGVIWLVIFGTSIYLESLAPGKSPFRAIDILIFLVTVSGLFGSGTSTLGSTYQLTVGYTIFLLIRNVCVFMIVPRARITTVAHMSKLAERYSMAGGLFLLLSSIAFGMSRGVNIGTRFYFKDEWLHPNQVAIYGGMVIILAIVAKNFNKFERIAAIAIASYSLLLMESRIVFIAIVATLMVSYIFAVGKNAIRVIGITFATGVLGWALFPLILPSISDFGPIRSMIDRTTNATDPTAGRLFDIQLGLEYWQQAPIFGFGYNSSPYSIDNFVVTHAIETGIVGVILYYFMLIAFFVAAVRTYKYSQDEDYKYVAKLAISFSSFVIIRSFTEVTGVFNLVDVMSNVAFFWIGLTVAGAGTLSLAKRQSSQQHFHYVRSNKKPESNPTQS